MRKSIHFILLLLSSQVLGQQSCFETKEHPLPALTEEGRKNLELKLTEAKKEYNNDTTNADAIIWLGRRTAYLGQYNEAISLFTKGITLHPGDARLYRHRGHRYITLRCFDKAMADFKKAAQLIKGKPDEVEPDGIPNAKNIPTSSLQSNIWYHLGLVYYTQGDYKEALQAYKKCLRVSANPDMYIATANWMYITLRKLNKNKEAKSLLASVKPGIEVIENKEYLEILLLYKQEKDFADPVSYLQKDKQGLGLASFGFGLGNYLLLNGKMEKARQTFQLITGSNQWAAFGFIAAEAELSRMK